MLIRFAALSRLLQFSCCCGHDAAGALLLRPGDVEATDLRRVLHAPSAALPFGTDITGRDLMAQVLAALFGLVRCCWSARV